MLAEIYSLAVNTERTIEQVLAEQYDYFSHLAGPIKTLRDVYDERKRKANAMDYDDLLVNCLRLFQEHKEVGERYREQFVHVLVDEYQDTNRIQADLIDAVAMLHRNLMVVGDDAQSIYSWRGANYRNILSFPERYPSARMFKIEVNYRSVPQILKLANDAIKANVHQFAKVLQPVRSGGGKPWLVPCADANQQAQFVAQRDAGVARRRRAAERDRRAVPRAFPRDGTADGTDAAQHPVRHHQRAAVLRAGAHQGRELLSEGRGQPARRDGVQADPETAVGHRREDGGQVVGEVSSRARPRQTAIGDERRGARKGARRMEEGGGG